MNPTATIHPDPLVGPSILKRSWRRFNRWLKRYFLVRLLYLFLLAACVCNLAFRPGISDHVRSAIRATELNSEPSLLNALARYGRVCQAHHLGLSLQHLMDTDGDGSLHQCQLRHLRQLGLQPQELGKRSIDLSLPRLIEASHRAGLLPRSYTASVARHDAWFAAEGEVEEMKKPVRAEVNAMLKTWQMRDYLQLETWKRGASRFLTRLGEVLSLLGSPGTVSLWLLLCFFVDLMVTACVPKGKLAVGLMSGAALALPVAFLTSLYLFFNPLFLELFGYDLMRAAPALGFLCLSVACAGYAGRIAAGPRPRTFYFSSGALGLGIVLLAWALPRWLSGEAFAPDSERTHWLLWQLMTDDRLLERQIPGWVKDTAVPLGVLSLIAGTFGFTGFPGFGRRRKLTVPAQLPESDKKEQG